MSDRVIPSPQTDEFIPVSVPCLTGQEWYYVKECLEGGWISSSGPAVDRFEKEFAQKIGVSDAVSVSSGTAALHLALHLCGIQAGEAVIAPTLTFIAPINAIRYVGAFPIFMDCDSFLNMDPKKLSEFFETECFFRNGVLTHKQTKARIRAILVVHVFGHPAQMRQITECAKKYNLLVIEDAAEAVGSGFLVKPFANQSVGTIGDFGCFSFNGNKLITAGGGGMLVAKDPAAVQKARYLSTQAKDDPDSFTHNEIGYNYRLTSLAAAVGLAQLEQLEKFIQIKRTNFDLYRNSLAAVPGLELIEEPDYSRSNYWFYTLRVKKSEFGESAEGLRQHLLSHKIATRPVWKLNHTQRPYVDFPSYRIENAVQSHGECLNLPCSVDLQEDQIFRICHLIKGAKK